MFTGIISDLGEILDVEEKSQGLRRLNIACGYDPDTIDIGASIACSGICLTVVERGRSGNRTAFAVDAAAETLRMTTANTWQRGTKLNLERSLRLGDELGGHMVSGHIDGIFSQPTGDIARQRCRSDHHDARHGEYRLERKH